MYDVLTWLLSTFGGRHLLSSSTSISLSVIAVSVAYCLNAFRVLVRTKNACLPSCVDSRLAGSTQFFVGRFTNSASLLASGLSDGCSFLKRHCQVSMIDTTSAQSTDEYLFGATDGSGDVFQVRSLSGSCSERRLVSMNWRWSTWCTRFPSLTARSTATVRSRICLLRCSIGGCRGVLN